MHMHNKICEKTRLNRIHTGSFRVSHISDISGIKCKWRTLCALRLPSDSLVQNLRSSAASSDMEDTCKLD